MKKLLILTLIFFTFSDFSSAGLLGLQDSSTCLDYSTCDDIDLHQESNRDHEQEGHEHHCHCHVSHFHYAIVDFSKHVAIPAIKQARPKYNFSKNGKTQNFNSDLIRPPIA